MSVFDHRALTDIRLDAQAGDKTGTNRLVLSLDGREVASIYRRFEITWDTMTTALDADHPQDLGPCSPSSAASVLGPDAMAPTTSSTSRVATTSGYRARTSSSATYCAADRPHTDRPHHVRPSHKGSTTDMATVHIDNTYSDGHHSERAVTLPEPASLSGEDLETWWLDVVFLETGDGHGAGTKLGSCYTATVTESASPALVGQSFEWSD